MNEPREKEFNYTAADLWDLPEKIFAELIDGEIVMQAAPLRIHQRISGTIYRKIGNYLEGKHCQVYIAPFSVRLFQTKDDEPTEAKTVVEPDISIVCNLDKLDNYGCAGAPDMIAEILSPSTSRHDRFVKFDLYARAGVKEYWIVDPDRKTVAVHLLEEGRYGSPIIYTQSAKVKVEVLDDCWIDLGEVFAE